MRPADSRAGAGRFHGGSIMRKTARARRRYMSPRAGRWSALMPVYGMPPKRETRAEDTPSTIVAARCQSAREGRSVRSCGNAVCSSSFENDLTGAMVCQSSFRRKSPLVLPYRAMFFNIRSCSVGYIASDKAESIENLIGMPWTRRFRARTPHAQLCSVWKRGSPEPCGMCTRRRPGGAPAADLGARQDQRLAARHRPPMRTARALERGRGPQPFIFRNAYALLRFRS